MTIVDSEELRPPSAVPAAHPDGDHLVAFRDDSGNAFRMRRFSNHSHTRGNPVRPLSITGNLRPPGDISMGNFNPIPVLRRSLYARARESFPLSFNRFRRASKE